MTPHPIDTEALRNLADAATPGPWEFTGRDDSTTWIEAPTADVLIHDERGSGHMRENFSWIKSPDAEFIAAARTAVPALLDENAALRAELHTAQDHLRQAMIELRGEGQWSKTLEHRATRAEAQSAIRGRAVVMYRERAREAEAERDWNIRSSRNAKRGRIQANARADQAEARIKAVEDVLSYADMGETLVTRSRIRRALDGDA